MAELKDIISFKGLVGIVVESGGLYLQKPNFPFEVGEILVMGSWPGNIRGKIKAIDYTPIYGNLWRWIFRKPSKYKVIVTWERID